MDIRIVNTCNNNCLFCLEQIYRKKNIKYENIDKIFAGVSSKDDKVINFYGGNPLLHPYILDILKIAKQKGFNSIGILTNTYSLNKLFLEELIINGLNNIGFYFNSFDYTKHNIVTGNGIDLQNLIDNIYLIKGSGLFYKTIIHTNKQNINLLSRDIYILNRKFGVKYFEFINYFPFDRPYENKNILEYDLLDYNLYIKKLFEMIGKLNLEVKFYKFSKDFFGFNNKFYDFQNGILAQIGKEDILRLSSKLPFCFKEKRCKYCFIRDNCNFYGN